jgi:hypothetical protein
MDARIRISSGRVVIFFVLSIIVAGCNTGASDQKTPTSPVTKTEPKTNASTSTPKTTPPSENSNSTKEASPPPNPPIVLSPAEIREGEKKGKSFLVEKYGGQEVEVTGSINGLVYEKDNEKKQDLAGAGWLHLHAGGTSLTNVAKFEIGTKDDMDKVLPGKKVTLRASIPKKGEKLQIIWRVVKVTDE